MTEAEIAIQRLTAWVRDHGDAKPQAFIGDVTMVLMLAKAYLAEHPVDDDEPVTNEWLWSLPLYRKAIWRWTNNFVFDVSGQSAPCKTRGDVRRLLAALGIEVPK